MKKKLLIIILIMPLLITSCQKADYDQLKMNFETLIVNGSYNEANALYQSADEETTDYYNQSLADYSVNLIYNAQNNLNAEEAKAILNSFLVFDYTRANVQQALDDILAYEQLVEFSKISYIEGIDLFLSRNYESAYQKLLSVQSFDVNYQNALNVISTIETRNAMWADAAAHNTKGRNSSLNSLAYKDGYVYFPVDNNNIHSIVKHNYETDETQVFPLVEYSGVFHIKGINIIGDYIYFIAGEELGTGAMLDTPYNIYEMKTDGTELTMVKAGDYFDLMLMGNTFYALSYSEGIVGMDQNFANQEIISDKWIIEMQATDNGVYYTEKLENTHDSVHILYQYKDGVSTEIMRNELLHVYFFDSYSIYYHDMSLNYREEIFVADLGLQNAQRVAILKDGSNGDMYSLIGALGDRILLNTAGWIPASSGGSMRQKIYSELTISSKHIDNYQSMKTAPYYEVINVLYEQGVEFIKHPDGTYSFSASPSDNLYEHTVSIPTYDAASLDINIGIINENKPRDDDFYSADEVIVEQDNFWYYSSPTLNVTIEKIYDESLETLLFIANVRTKDMSGFNIAYGGSQQAPGEYNRYIKTDDIAKLNYAVFATNGDFAMHAPNQWSGKVIRDSRIFDALESGGIKEYDVEKVYDYGVNCDDFLVMYPNGEMVAYTEHDGITYGNLLESGVENFLSFGPILVRDDDKTSATTNPRYYISGVNPRCAWGMVEAGHYIAVVADGRQSTHNVSRGLSFYSLSELFQNLGCSVAYNLDGGQTAAMTFMGRFLNTHQYDNNGEKWVNHRAVWEIVYFGTSDLVPYNLENYYEE